MFTCKNKKKLMKNYDLIVELHHNVWKHDCSVRKTLQNDFCLRKRTTKYLILLFKLIWTLKKSFSIYFKKSLFHFHYYSFFFKFSLFSKKILWIDSRSFSSSKMEQFFFFSLLFYENTIKNRLFIRIRW